MTHPCPQCGLEYDFSAETCPGCGFSLECEPIDPPGKMKSMPLASSEKYESPFLSSANCEYASANSQSLPTFPLPPSQEQNLSKIGKTMAIIFACSAGVGLIPCFGWLNWLIVLGAVITKIVCIVALHTEAHTNPSARGDALIGLILSVVVAVVATIRLYFGLGCC